MKNFLLLVFFLLCGFFALAQLSLTIGPQISAGAESKKNGVGLNGEAIIHILKDGKLRLFSGYTQFHNGRVNYVPIRAGYQHQIFNRFIILGDIGTGTLLYPEYNYTRLSYGLGAGYKVPVNKHFLQFSIVYEHTKQEFEGYFGWVNYRIAYGIDFKK